MMCTAWLQLQLIPPPEAFRSAEASNSSRGSWRLYWGMSDWMLGWLTLAVQSVAPESKLKAEAWHFHRHLATADGKYSLFSLSLSLLCVKQKLIHMKLQNRIWRRVSPTSGNDAERVNLMMFSGIAAQFQKQVWCSVNWIGHMSLLWHHNVADPG